MSHTIIGLDIGGANLKAASSDGQAVSQAFPLWKEPECLGESLGNLLKQFTPASSIAVTMTGELCDCFPTLRAGVNFIGQTVAHLVGDDRRVHFWGTDGKYHDLAHLNDVFELIAASNWHALATFVGRYVPNGLALLIDIGSTTTDIIPLLNGTPQPSQQTDYGRLKSGELVYQGVRRTPVMAVLPTQLAAEYFADMHDVYLILNDILEDPFNLESADGRPRTIEFARSRLARMLCSDMEHCTLDEINLLAKHAKEAQCDRLLEAIERVLNQQDDHQALDSILISGSGEFLGSYIAEIVKQKYQQLHLFKLSELISPTLSECAPAYALARLAYEQCL